MRFCCCLYARNVWYKFCLVEFCMYVCMCINAYTFSAVEFVDQYLSLSTVLPGTESLYGLGEHKVSLKLKKLVGL